MKNDDQNIIKLLFLYKLLRQKELTKEEIVEEFQKENVICAKSTVLNYIDILRKNNIEVSIKKENRKNVYHIKEKSFIEFNITNEELAILNDIKKLLISKKNLNYIRKTLRLFLRLALHVKDNDTRENLIDFGYFSSLKQSLIEQLKTHSEKNDVITLDYLLPSGENRDITIHADSVKIDTLSNRLYLFGVLQNGWQFSKLPVDRINGVKKILKNNMRFNLRTTVTNYTVASKVYQKSKKDSKEEIIEETDEMTTVQIPLDDDFKILQRLLYFCPDLYNITNLRIKNMVIDKLKMMIEYYETKLDV